MKQTIRQVIRLFRYDIVRWTPRERKRGFNAAHLATICTPKTVFDVGVGFGTFPLYEAYPDARFVLVEPLTDYREVIEGISAKYDCRVYYTAVGSRPGQIEFQVDMEDPEKSSFASRSGLTSRNHRTEKRLIDVTTLDAILKENSDLERPILLKIDTEGYEIEALKGAEQLLGIADMVIAEVSVAERFTGGYTFEDMILFMKDRGYRVADILSIAHADGELQPRHMDVVFTKSVPKTAR